MPNLILNVEGVKTVNRPTYLDSCVKKHGSTAAEMNAGIFKARAAYTRPKQL